jgi:SAM-dependent methyltransferase
MTHSLTQFYDDLTPFYHLLYPDWRVSVQRQAQMLDEVIRMRWGGGVTRVLDAACGIGTQTLGLAALGYQVTASDLSSREVERASREAADQQLVIDFSVADMRQAFQHHGSAFDLVIACDNAVPHLLTDQEILKAFQSFYACIRPGGGCLISVRDYGQEQKGEKQVKLYGTREENGITYLIFQLWDWQGSLYDLSLYFIADDGSAELTTRVFRSTYYAVGTDRLLELMQEAGFHDVERLDELYFQPLLVGTHPFSGR